MKLNFKYISSCRTGLMGFATLLILICHAPANGVAMPTILKQIFRLGGVGVDLFLFCSGVGMFYSLIKKKANNVWYWNRYVRILIPFLLFAIPYYFFRMVVDGDSIWLFLENITTISYYTRHEGAWFVAMLLPLYLLTPLIGKTIDGYRNRLIPTIILILLSIIGASVISSNTIIINVQMFLSHFPSFLMGYLSARYILDAQEVGVKWIVMALLSCIIIYPLFHYIPVSCNWLFVLPFSLILTSLFSLISNKYIGYIRRVFNFLGSISLESYLVNIFLPVVLRKSGLASQLIQYDKGNYLFYAIIICVGLVIAYLGHLISTRIVSVLKI